MLYIQASKKEVFAKFLMIFVIIQPLLDLLTSFSILSLNLSMTPGIIIRFLIMLVSAFYILFSAKEKRNRKYLYYLIGLALFFLVHLILNITIKDPFSLMEELKSIAKIIYPIEMLFAFILAFKDLRKTDKIQRYFPFNISSAVWIVNIVMLVATITSTGIRSYNGLYKDGHSGWFFAANELGTLLAIAFPIILWIAVKKTTTIKKTYHWIQVLLSGLSLFVIGTKVGFLAVIIGLGLAIFGIVLEWLVNRKEKSAREYILNFTILSVLLGGTIIAMPYLPAFTNTTAHLQALEEQQPKENSYSDVGDTEEITEEENLFGENEGKNESVLGGVVYSGRDGFLKMHKQFFKDAPFTQKILGMGYAGNYEKAPKIIERDFHDIYYQFGLLGSVLLLLPLIFYGIRILIFVLKNFVTVLSVKYILIATSLMLGLGIAYLAGHMLSAPAVSTYFIIILGYLIVDLKVE